MKRLTYSLPYAAILSLTMAAAVWAADASFSGSWKLNVAKSQLSGTTYTFSKTASGGMHFDDGAGFAYDFDLSGKDIKMPSGMTVAVTAPSATTWEFTFKSNGKVTSKSTATLNGNSLAWVSDVTNPEGKPVRQMDTDPRISGGPGFFGKWKGGEIKGGATTLQITMQGTNGITLKSPEYQNETKANFDGKEYTSTTAGQATKFVGVFEKTGANSFKVTTKLDGKPYATDVYTLSADGKTLTDETTVIATNEKTKSVYDRQ